jgi:hypothetical protein
MAKVYFKAAEARTDPEVSIIIPCYNYGHWVGGAISSAAAQLGATHEVIVVNDCSTDNSREIIDSYKGIATVIHNDSNLGVSESRNRGASVARGQYLAFLDADDEMADGWLKATITAMRQHPRAGIAYTGLMLVSHNARRQADWPPPVADQQSLLKCLNTVPTCCLIRKEAFIRAGGYRRRFEPTEDGELWTRIAECGYDVVSASVKPLFNYRVGHDSLSRGKALPDYRGWHLPSISGKPPFAAICPPPRESFEVRDYDRPVVSVVISHQKGKTPNQLLDTLDMLVGQTFRFWEVWVWGGGAYPDMRSFPFVRTLRSPSKELRAPLVFIVDSGDNIFDGRSIEKAMFRWQHTGRIESGADVIPLMWLEKVGGIMTGDTRQSVEQRLRHVGMIRENERV